MQVTYEAVELVAITTALARRSSSKLAAQTVNESGRGARQNRHPFISGAWHIRVPRPTDES
ncbi:hypothetical protein [Desulfitobacterium sp.]|uniref:hypothetical protein n=1 Tax=Desulfitobacterium sp. TaxID=49981 RepID=UPI002C242311|nr:hypothetical protein [Desulfitobacterium sp.]HVJ50669.1 hypothetical protein [Desulfitobacterium sp.]